MHAGERNAALWFASAGLLFLVAAAGAGVMAGMQYVVPELIKSPVPFVRTRPFHVTLSLSWIFSAAIGGLYAYLPGVAGRALFVPALVRVHLALFLATTVAILASYVSGHFGGREYLEFPPVLGLPVATGWLLLLVNVLGTLVKSIRTWPVYVWMWVTGALFFVLTTAESYLWLIPWFRDNIVRDITVQWKALGAMVGSWNMLVYGTAFYLMERIGGDPRLSRSRAAFFLYFLGLVNLMFNWGHHTYVVPMAWPIREVAYAVSMTELLILGNIILNWRKSLDQALRLRHHAAMRFLVAADVWIFLNLCLAIAISVPAINRYTHGTHITVAHAMGATVGINTMILLASLVHLAGERHGPVAWKRAFHVGFGLTNAMLLVFWISLLGAGTVKAVQTANGAAFQPVMERLKPWFEAFALSGFGLCTGLILVAIPILKKCFPINVSRHRNE